jgi:hypothetical protein
VISGAGACPELVEGDAAAGELPGLADWNIYRLIPGGTPHDSGAAASHQHHPKRRTGPGNLFTNLIHRCRPDGPPRRSEDADG